jgi:hypothetical protein
MKIVQTKLDEEEYELLKELMYSKGVTINLFFLRKGLPKEYFLNPQIRLWGLNHPLWGSFSPPFKQLTNNLHHYTLFLCFAHYEFSSKL